MTELLDPVEQLAGAFQPQSARARAPLARVVTSCPELAGAAVVAAVSDGPPENSAAAREDGCHVIVVRPAPAAALVEAVELALAARG